MERNIKWPHLPGHNKTTFATAFPQKWFLPPPSPIKTKAGPFNCHSCLKEIFGGFDQSWLYPRPIYAYHYSDLLCSSMYQEGLHPWIFDRCNFRLPLLLVCRQLLYYFQWVGTKGSRRKMPIRPLPPIYLSVLLTWYQCDISTWSVHFFSQAWSAQGDGTLGKNFTPLRLVL